jgi:hypothetical protein
MSVLALIEVEIPFVPVPRLREAQKIETDSRKQLLKINIKTGFKLMRPET